MAREGEGKICRHKRKWRCGVKRSPWVARPVAESRTLLPGIATIRLMFRLAESWGCMNYGALCVALLLMMIR